MYENEQLRTKCDINLMDNIDETDRALELVFFISFIKKLTSFFSSQWLVVG